MVSRYIPDSRQLKPAQCWRAFLPDRAGNETSVFRINGLPDDAIWEIGDEHVAPTRGEIIGRADLAESSLANPLVLEDAPPPPRHMAIRGWPSLDAKEQVHALAQKVASLAQLRPRSRVI